MDQYLTTKYLGMVSPRLGKFKQKSPTVWNFRCPYCGDSKRHKNKARAYIYEREGRFYYTCHNCSINKTFDSFLQDQDNSLHSEYAFERMGRNGHYKPEKTFITHTPVFRDDKRLLKGLPSINEMSDISPFRNYVIGRHIPEEFWQYIFVCIEFKKFTNKLVPEKFDAKSLRFDEPRLLFPFFDEEKQMFAYAGRSIRPDTELRYINIVLDTQKPKLYGVDRWNKKEKTYVVEGCIDSFFLSNSLATAGGDIVGSLFGIDKTLLVIVYDNEKYSFHTKKKLTKALDLGYSVCIWPSNIVEKDINAMVLAGTSPETIQATIDQNTFSGLQGQLQLARWSRK